MEGSEAPPLAAARALAARLVHLDEQVLHVLDLPLHRLGPLPQLPVPRLQPLALALQRLALRPLPLAGLSMLPRLTLNSKAQAIFLPHPPEQLGLQA